MIDEATVYRELAPIFSDVFMRKDIALRPELSAKDVKDWDSFKQIEIILTVEQRFGVKFTSKEVDTMGNVGDLVAIVASRGQM